jgi:hypothetical protein
MVITPPLTPKAKIRTHDHALHHNWPSKRQDSNPRPCTTPPLTPKRQRFEHTTMHYTIDPKKAKVRTHDHALHHQWPPKVKDSNPQTHHALHHWPPKSLRFEPKTIDLQWPPKVKDPRPCTTPPLTLKKTRFEPKTMHSPEWRQHSYHSVIRCIAVVIQLAISKLRRFFRLFVTWQYIYTSRFIILSGKIPRWPHLCMHLM